MALEATFDSRFYLDTAVLDRERERLFRRAWLCAGRADRIPRPGDYFTLTSGDDSVLVVRRDDGAIGAFHNVCRHRGARLCASEAGHLEGGVVCPYHGWTYGLDGRLRGTPHLSGSVPRGEFGLYPVAVEVWAGFVFVNLQGDGAPPLLEQLGPIPGRIARYPLATLKSGARRTDVVACNWKILIENYLECYHCPGVHPELCDLVPLYRRGVVDGAGGEVAWFRPGATTFTLGGTTRRPLLPGLDDDEKRQYNGELILPNTMLNLFPDYAHVRTLWPIAPGRTRVETEWLFDPGAMARPDFSADDAVSFITLVSRQDWNVCEAVQQGVASPAHRSGVYAPQEEQAAGFKRWVVSRLERQDAAG